MAGRRRIYAERVPLVLRFHEGLTLAAVATAMGCAESTAHARVRRGLDLLRGDELVDAVLDAFGDCIGLVEIALAIEIVRPHERPRVERVERRQVLRHRKH